MTTFAGPVRSIGGFMIGNLTMSKLLMATAMLDFASIAAGEQADLTIPVVGATVGDTVMMTLPPAPTDGLVFNAFVSATNTVTLRASNISTDVVDSEPATYSVVVFGVA